MSEPTKQHRAAIEAVASHFSAELEPSEDPVNAHILIAGKRIAVEVRAIKQPIADRADLQTPRLRFDKVVRRLLARLRTTLRESVPDGTTVILTITAPIRQPAKTTEALEDHIRASLARGSTPVQCEDTIHGNQIRICLVTSGSKQTSKVIGLVHNPDSDPAMLLHMTQSLLQHIGAAADRRTPATSATERWLVVSIEDRFPPIETYRQVCAQLSFPTCFAKILMVFAGNLVETLAG